MTAVRSDTNALVKKALKSFLAKWEEECPDVNPFSHEDQHGKPQIRNADTAMEMLFHYIEERRSILQSRDFKLLAIEQPFAVPLDADRSDLFYIGRLDKVFEYQGRIYIGEHKTTTSYKKDGPFRSDFVDSFSPNSQVDGYLYAAHLIYGKRVKACWIDAALVHQHVHDGFRFIPIERQLQQLAGWVWEARYWVEQIEANERVLGSNQPIDEYDYLPAFPKNTTSCTNYGGCPFLDLCKMWSNPINHDDPAGFKIEKWEPFDALEFGKAKGKVGGTDKQLNRKMSLYDNTRLQSFRTCARAFYFRHCRDLTTADTRLPLVFGSCWHEAMDIVWKELARK
jgi:hypothetical protein